MYKNKDKQKEAAKSASKKYRDKQKGMTQGMTEKGMTKSDSVIPRELKSNLIVSTPTRKATIDVPECAHQHCQNAREHGKTVFHVWKPHYELRGGQYNRVTLPGDEDYVGVA